MSYAFTPISSRVYYALVGRNDQHIQKEKLRAGQSRCLDGQYKLRVCQELLDSTASKAPGPLKRGVSQLKDRRNRNRQRQSQGCVGLGSEEADCAIGDVRRSPHSLNPWPHGICKLVLGLIRIKFCIVN